MDQQLTIKKFHEALPVICAWIDNLLEENQSQAVELSNLKFQRIPQYFPQELLNKVKVVTTPQIPMPPLSALGLSELAQMENQFFDGVTYKDTFFVRPLRQIESLYFHELVHIVQWERLGVEDFLLTYGLGIVQFGYRCSPLEEMAYRLQAKFEQSMLSPNVTEQIYKETDMIWQQVAPLFQKN